MKKVWRRVFAVACVAVLLVGTIRQGVPTLVADAAKDASNRAREWRILSAKDGDEALKVVDTGVSPVVRKAYIDDAGVDLPDDISEGNLALYVKLNVMADEASVAALNTLGTYIELCNERADEKERSWKLGKYGLRNGENELLLYFADSGYNHGVDGKQTFEWRETINFFRFYTEASFQDSASCIVTISEIRIVYTDVGLQLGEDDTYLQLKNALDTMPVTMEASIKKDAVENSTTGWTLAKAGTGILRGSSVSSTTSEDIGPEEGTYYEKKSLDNGRLAVESVFDIHIPERYVTSAENLADNRLAVAFWLYSSENISLGDGQLELNSSGKQNDRSEIHYMLRDMAALEQGWNYIVLPLYLFASDARDGAVDMAALNYMKLYTAPLTGTFAVTDMKLIVMEADSAIGWTVAKAFLYDSSRNAGLGYSFNNAAYGKMGITEGNAGEPKAGTVYAETVLANKALTFSRTLDSPIPDAYKMASTADLASSKLAVSFWVYSSAEGASLGDGQLELTSCGKRNDSSEIRYKLIWLPTLKAGWNYLELPLSSFAYTETGGAVDMQNLNYLNFYTTAVKGEHLTGTFRISDIRIVVRNSGGSTPGDAEPELAVTKSVYESGDHYMIFSNTESGDSGQTALLITSEGYPAYVEGETQYTLNQNVCTGAWADIAVVREKDKIIFYIDGQAVASVAADQSHMTAPSAKHCIGADSLGGQRFKGVIADVRLWSDVRTADEIKANLVDKETIALTSNNLDMTDETLIGSWFLVGDSQYVLEAMPDNANGNDAVFLGSRAKDWFDYDKTQYDFLYDANGEENYWSMIFIPDIQNLVTGKYTNLWYTMAEWIADNTETEHVKHVIGAGDSTWSNTDIEYTYARNGFDAFSDLVSWSNMIGNHDYVWRSPSRDSAQYNKYFGKDYINGTMAGRTFAGSYEDPYDVSDAENSYYTFSVNGMKWMILQLEYYPRRSVLTWANKVLEEHPNHNVILTTHGYLDGYGNYTGNSMQYTTNDDMAGGYLGNTTETIWNEVVKTHSSVKLVLCGHSINGTGSIATQTLVNDAGDEISALMINAQDKDMTDTNGKNLTAYYTEQGLGMLGILRFSADGKHVAVQYYAPGYEKSYNTESNAITLSLNTVACSHEHTAVYNQDAATGTKPGYTGDTYCVDCGTLVQAGTVIPATGIIEDPDNAGDAGNAEGVGAKTGDDVHMAVWVVILIMSSVMIVGGTIFRKRQMRS